MSPFPVIAGIVFWVTYLVTVPVLWMHSVPLALVAIATLGGYLAVGIGYFRHELYHNYYTPLSRPLYQLTSFLVFSDPQVFRIAHPLHHGSVHTTEDIEFFCQDYETDRAGRRWQFFMELLFGNAAWEWNAMQRLKAEKRFRRVEGLGSLLCRAALLAAIWGLSIALHPGSSRAFFACYVLTLWWGAVTSRHNQWLEHAGIVSDGTFEERNLLTRNLPDTSFLNRAWNLYHHNDPRGHVLHHTKAGINSRVVPMPLPEGARQTSVAAYPRILLDYYRSL